jgi:uncharacterized membrane protein (GlpM family)
MDSLSLLKQEINKTMESEHDLAKWKLGVTAALGGAAFGLAKDNPNYWLLLSVPFVCAYVDLYLYQYQLRIRVIARFLREKATSDLVLQEYEQRCQDLRDQHIFSLGNWAAIGCSLGVSVLGPVFYFLQRMQHKGSPDSLLVSPVAAGMIWLVGALLIVCLWWYFQNQAEDIEKVQPARAA